MWAHVWIWWRFTAVPCKKLHLKRNPTDIHKSITHNCVWTVSNCSKVKVLLLILWTSAPASLYFNAGNTILCRSLFLQLRFFSPASLSSHLKAQRFSFLFSSYLIYDLNDLHDFMYTTWEFYIFYFKCLWHVKKKRCRQKCVLFSAERDSWLFINIPFVASGKNLKAYSDPGLCWPFLWPDPGGAGT